MRVRGFPATAAPCSRGFTLLEVLAAIAMLAIVFVVGVGALGRAAQNVATSAALDTAVEHAQSLLAEQGLTAPLEAGRTSGTFPDGMAWTLTIRALPRATNASDNDAAALPQQGAMFAQASAIDLYQLDVAVQYGAGRTLRLSTQRAQAAPGGQQ